MSSVEIAVGAAVVAAVLAVVGGGVALHLWRRRVATRLSGGWWWVVAWLPAIGLGLLAIDGLMSVVHLIHAVAGVAGVDPSMKATLLAKGISEAMDTAAASAFPGLVHLAVAPVLLAIGSARATVGTALADSRRGRERSSVRATAA